ncbi:sporulation protein [Saccharomonospora piscinae]|uniref:sporulation protein n=1 Tax=Saccharomonospora piscinae TaxID=687388 RepID=UPI00046560D1|nr:sporulation protein [Saccharomonospora piscinae]
MFKRLLSAFGAGGASVDTVLDSPHALPGQVLTGQVHIEGGGADAVIDEVTLSLLTRVEVEYGSGEHGASGELARVVAARNLRVPSRESVVVPFQLQLPWESPITALEGSPLPGAGVGLRTELVVADAPDEGDLDPVLINPLPSQVAVLRAFGDLGLGLQQAENTGGRLPGMPQGLPFFQELELVPQSGDGFPQVQLTFVTTPQELHVALEANKRGGLFRQDGDHFGRFHAPHGEAEQRDWTPEIGQWLHQVGANGMGAAPGYPGEYGHPGGEPERSGPGVGGVIAGAAAGVVGGMVLGEVVDGVFDGDDVPAVQTPDIDAAEFDADGFEEPDFEE